MIARSGGRRLPRTAARCRAECRAPRRCRTPCRSAGPRCRRRGARARPPRSPWRRPEGSSGVMRSPPAAHPAREPHPRAPASRSEARVASRAPASTSCSMSWAAPSLGERRSDVATGGAHRRGRVRHGRAMADRGDHLQVVELVADREDVRHRHAARGGPATRPATPFDTPGRRNSRKRGWLTVTSARPANRSRAACRTSCGDRVVGRPQMTFETGCRTAGDQVVDEHGPAAEPGGVVVGVRVVWLG